MAELTRHNETDIDSAIREETARRKGQGSGPGLTRRRIYQAWQASEKMLDLLWGFRMEARLKKHYEVVAALTEAIFYIKRARALLDVVSKGMYHRDADEFESYQ